MHYISTGSFAVAATQPVTLRQARVRSGRTRGGAEGGDRPTTSAISCNLTAPQSVLIADGADGRLELVKLGFTISLPSQATLRWIRFSIYLPSDQAAAPRIMSLYPSYVTAGTIAHGRMAVGTKGELAREQAVASRPDAADAIYRADVVGCRRSDAEAFWDWLPASRGWPLGTDELFLSASCPAGTTLRCTRSVQFVVDPNGENDAVLYEHSADTADVPQPEIR